MPETAAHESRLSFADDVKRSLDRKRTRPSEERDSRVFSPLRSAATASLAPPPPTSEPVDAAFRPVLHSHHRAGGSSDHTYTGQPPADSMLVGSLDEMPSLQSLPSETSADAGSGDAVANGFGSAVSLPSRGDSDCLPLGSSSGFLEGSSSKAEAGAILA